jgi:hypothetical protein
MGDVGRRVMGLLLLLGGLSAAPYASSPAVADCGGPQLTIDGASAFDPSTAVPLHRGDEVTVDGLYFVRGCDDNGSSGSFGCSPDDDLDPMSDIELRLVGTGASFALGVEDADADGRTSWTFTVPETAPLGAARLEADDYSEPFHVSVVD